MTCESCGDKPKHTDKSFTKAVIEIDNPETLVLLRKVVIPASLGTDTDVPPAVGKYKNVVLYYEANKHVYIYSSDGIPTFIESELPQELLDRIEDLEDGLSELEQEFDDFKNSPDVVDIVATYADLQSYDTSSLGDKDVIRVLADETHDGQSAYYRWSTSTQSWTFIGTVGDYYTKTQVDNLIATAPAFKPFPSSVDTDGTTQEFMDSILALHSAVGTAYIGTVSLSDMPAGLIQEEVEVYVYSDYVIYCIMRSTDVAPYEWWCASYNYQGWKASDTTYSTFTGTDGSTAGTAGLVPAPAASDSNKFLKSDGTWSVGNGRAYTLTAADYNANSSDWDDTDPSHFNCIALWKLPDGYYSSNVIVYVTKLKFINPSSWPDSSSFIIGSYNEPAPTPAKAIIVLGRNWDGVYQKQTHLSVYSVLAGSGTAVGYWSAYDVINNLESTSPVNPLSANQGKALKDLIDSLVIKNAGAPTTSTVGTVGKLYEDTTNGKLYICTAASGGTYTWVEVGTGGGGGGISTQNFYIDSADLPSSVGSHTSGKDIYSDAALTQAVDGMDIRNALDSSNVVVINVIDNLNGADPIKCCVLSASVPSAADLESYNGMSFDFSSVEFLSNPAGTYISCYFEGPDPSVFGFTMKGVSGGGSGPTVVQTTGTSQTDVMSQNATSLMVYDSSRVSQKDAIRIGAYAAANAQGAVGIGDYAYGALSSAEKYSTAIGSHAQSNKRGSVAIGSYSTANSVGEMNIGSSSTTYGYNSSNYRLLTGLYDPQNAHDAATKGYVDAELSYKQDELTAGAGISITDESGDLVISATNSGPTITMTTTDPGEGSALATDNYVGVYGGDPIIMDYSTSEVNTGAKWIDGSAIYKKTVNVGTLPDTTTKNVAHGISNLGTIIKIEGIAIGSSYTTPLPFVAEPTAANQSTAIRLYATSTNVVVDTGTDRTALSAYVTLYYTKSS